MQYNYKSNANDGCIQNDSQFYLSFNTVKKPNDKVPKMSS